MSNTPTPQALFRKVGKDGAEWLFVVSPDEQWAITRNGEEVTAGKGASVAAGVGRFITLARVSLASPTRCDPAVGELLNRIERDKPAAMKVAMCDETIRPRAPQGISGCFSA